MKEKYDDLKIQAEKSAPEFLLYYKKNKNKIDRIDTVVHQLHMDISEKINCLDCANCCRQLGPAIYDKDIERMSKYLRMKPSQLTEKYLRIDEDGDYVFKSMPCPFLMQDKYCSIYEVRPKACREYPHTDRKKFYQIHALTIKNAETCPAVFHTLEQLKQEF